MGSPERRPPTFPLKINHQELQRRFLQIERSTQLVLLSLIVAAGFALVGVVLGLAAGTLQISRYLGDYAMMGFFIGVGWGLYAIRQALNALREILLGLLGASPAPGLGDER